MEEEAEPVVDGDTDGDGDGSNNAAAVGDDTDDTIKAVANGDVDNSNGNGSNDAGDDVDDNIEGSAARGPGPADGTAAAAAPLDGDGSGGSIATNGEAVTANEHGHSYQQHHGHKWRSEHHKAQVRPDHTKTHTDASEQVGPDADAAAAVCEDGGSDVAAPGSSDDTTPASEPTAEPSQGSQWVADFADFSAAPAATNAAADMEWGSPVAFTADGGSDFGEWGGAPFGADDGSAQVMPPPPVAEGVNTADPLLAACFAGTEDVAALLRQLEFGGGPAAELQQYTQDPATAVEIEIDRAFAKEPEDTIQWSRSMMELLLYAQLGVAVPRYAPPPKKKKYFAAMERFTTKVMNDDSVEALDLKETPAEHTLLDGLLSSVSSTAKVTLMPFSALGRGLGAAGSAIGSAASRITSFSGSDGDRPKSPERRSREASLRRTKSLSNGKKGADDEEKSIFATSLANLSPAELEALGMKFGGVVGAHGRNEIPDDSFLTPEARALAEQMRKMEAVLLEEEAELARQDRIIEIERREEELYPEKVNKDPADLSRIDDAWSREMREQGLKHVSCDGDERRIFHEALPEEFDLNKFLSSTSPPRSPAAAQSGPVLEPETAATGAEALAADASEPNGRSGAADEAGLVVEESQASAPSTAEPATKPDEAQADSPAESAPATEATTPGEKEDAMALAAGDGGDGAPAGNVHGRPADGEPDGESWA